MAEVEKVLEEGTEQQWNEYFTTKYSELETETDILRSGVKTRLGRGFRKVGYETLRDFYDGDQWLYIPEGGRTMPVYNYIRGVAQNYTAFMTNEPIDVDVPAVDITDDIEVARAEAKEKVLREILEDNQFDYVFEESVLNGSLLGDSIILGAFLDKNKGRIWFANEKMPENVKILWTDNTYKEIYGFIWERYISSEKLYEDYEDEIKEKKIHLGTEDNSQDKTSAYAKSQRHLLKVLDCWTKDVHLVKLSSQVLKFEDNDYGFVPIIHIPNIIHPEEPYGISDIEDLIDSQVEYNEKNSDMSEIISQNAYDFIFGKNLKPTEIQSGMVNLIDLGDEAELMPDPRRPRSNDISNDINVRKSDMFQLSGLNENVFGGQNVRAVTGRALSVLMQTVNNRVKGRQTRWIIALKKLFAGIFQIIEKEEGAEGKQLVAGFYKTDIFFPGTLVRNITDEINKFNAKLQSQETTMKNMGIPSPKDEKQLMTRELQDQLMMVEISRNPGLQIQLHQMMQQQLAQQVAGQKPILREDENMEEQPVAAGGAPQQSAQSLEGAIAQAGQRNGANTNLEKE